MTAEKFLVVPFPDMLMFFAPIMKGLLASRTNVGLVLVPDPAFDAPYARAFAVNPPGDVAAGVSAVAEAAELVTSV